MTYAKDDRVLIRPLGQLGTVSRVRDDGRYAVLSDSATQDVVWAENELALPEDDPVAYASEHSTGPAMDELLDEVKRGRERRVTERLRARYQPPGS